MGTLTRGSRNVLHFPGGWLVGVCAAAVLMGLAGCGTNFDAVAAQTGNAVGITILDILLTDFTNQVADAVDQNAPRPADAADDDADPDGDGDGDDVADDPPGEQAYAGNGCGACHGGAGEGGSAVALDGADQTDAMEERFGGGANHMGSTLTDQEIADITAWLLGDGAGEDGGAPDGAVLYADNCSTCHGDDGTGGVPIAGLSADELSAGLASAVHGSITLSDEEIAAIVVFLGG